MSKDVDSAFLEAKKKGILGPEHAYEEPYVCNKCKKYNAQ